MKLKPDSARASDSVLKSFFTKIKWITMYKIGIISFLIIFCTYLVISSTAPNQSEIDSKSLALNNSNGQVSYWFDLETIHDYTLKCYRYIQYYCVLIFTEGQYQLAWDGLFEDLFNFVQTVENFVRDIDLSALKKNLTDFIKRIELTDFHLRYT